MHTNKKRVGYSVNPLVAAVTGAVVGAGMAVAGAVVMSDKKNQAKVKNVAKNVSDKANNLIKDVQSQIKNKKFETEIKAQKLGNIAKDAVNDVKNI